MSATQLASSVLLKVQKYFEGKLNIFFGMDLAKLLSTAQLLELA